MRTMIPKKEYLLYVLSSTSATRHGESFHTGLKEMQRFCFPSTPQESPQATVLRLKGQSCEMSIHMHIYELDLFAGLDSGAQRSVLPLHH